MTEKPEDKYHWIVLFSKGGRLYPYLHRTIPHMTEVVGKFFNEHGTYPYRMWVIVDDEIQKVVIQ